ncbi:ArsR/SmtB family transcription factor [Micrococcoides hystricis]|uniref:ArsR/SmtB family transcription factor n=1 Tax=Micrococcoides hystricis TaxID=1572761 RepID=A0ABV6PC54_9MICC
MQFEEAAEILRVLANPKRAQIVDVISTEEMHAKELLDYFQISQPTLSHDMKQLQNAGIVNARRAGRYIFYSLNQDRLRAFHSRLGELFFASKHGVARPRRNGTSSSN